MPDAVPLRSALIRVRDADTDVEVDLRAGTVLRGGLRARLPQHALDTLRILLSTPGETVPWSVLRDRMWDRGSEAEFEARIYDAVRRLREAFGDNPEHPRLVETVAGLGFRFIPPIQSAHGLGSSRPSAPPGTHGTGAGGSGSAAASGGELPSSDTTRYEVLERIGAGAMGEVYRARDLRLDREVAIKFLPEWMAADPLALHRFRREAYATASLNHPNVLAVHDLAVIDGAPCMVSELLVGHTLRTALSAGPIRCRTPSRTRSRSSTALRPRTARGSSTATSSRRTCSSRATGT
jgi:DNA-binding winged helix-turn-helix (wHTH) protein